MAQQPVISVRGEAWLEAEPEIAVISVTVQDATRRAQEYAGAFGGQLGPLLEAADAGLLTGHPDQHVQFRAGYLAASAPRSAAEPPNLDLEPVRQPVTAHVDARFAIVLPGQPPP